MPVAFYNNTTQMMSRNQLGLKLVPIPNNAFRINLVYPQMQDSIKHFAARHDNSRVGAVAQPLMHHETVNSPFHIAVSSHKERSSHFIVYADWNVRVLARLYFPNIEIVASNRSNIPLTRRMA